MNIQIKRASEDDLEEMLALGYEFWKQTEYHAQGVRYDVDHISSLTQHLMKSGIVQIARINNELVGMILMVLGPVPFDPRIKAATELAYYVSPKHRNDGVGRRLLKQAENIGKQLGVKLFTMIHLDEVDPSKPEKVYEGTGYRKSETLFTKEL